MTYVTCGGLGGELVICPYCDSDAFGGKSEGEVRELINLCSRNRQKVSCLSCGGRFILRKDQADDFTVRAY